MRVAVVGGGYAGCAAAVTAAARGDHVTLYEASRVLGGRARRVELPGGEAEGFPALDNGQHILVGAYTELLALMETVGVDAGVLERRPLDLRVLPDFHLRAARPGRLGLALGFLGARGLGVTDRLRALALLVGLRARRYRIDPDVPVAGWLEARGQSARLRRCLWEPLCVAALNTPTAEASAQLFANVLRDTLDGAAGASDMLVPRVDLSALFPEPAGRYVARNGGEVVLGTAVRTIAPRGDGWRIDDDTTPYDAIVIATSAHAAARLLEPHPAAAPARALLAALDHQPIYTVYLRYPASVGLPQSMLGIAGPLVQWAFDRGRLGGPAGLIAAVISARGAHEDHALAALGERVADELQSHFPDWPRPLAIRTIAERRATFSARPSLERPHNACGLDRVMIAGDYTASDYPGTLESAARSGIRAALALSGLLRPSN